MNKIFIYTLTIILSLTGLKTSFAQINTTEQKDETASGINLVKINLLALPVGNFSFQYERALNQKISAAISLRLMPESNLPFKSAIENLVDDDETWKHLDKLKIGNFAITPEVRFYMGENVLKGFYIAPFARFASYKAKMPFDFEYDHPIDGPKMETIPLDGKITSFTGGVMVGAQWKLSKVVYLDWWILGPSYGTAKGDISGKKDLSDPQEREALRDELKDLETDDVITVTTEVNESGANVHLKGPWGGVRAGLAIGYRF